MTREMRDSGVEWIGKIPKNWRVSKIKYELECKDELREPISAEKRERKNPQYDYYGASGIIDKIDYYNIDDEVLLIGEDGANLLMRNLPLVYKAKGKFWVNNHAHILKPFSHNNYDYLGYLLEVGDYTNYITGSAQPKLSQSNLMSFYILSMPIDEQKKIADYLDKKCAEIDSLSSDIQSQINILEDYKKSVITEAVTKGLKTNVEMKDSGIEWIGKIPKEWEISKLKYILSSPLMYGANESGEDFNEAYPRYIRITDIDDNHRLKEEGKLSLCPAIAMQYLLSHNDILFARSGASVGKTFLYKEEYGKSAFAGYLIKAHLNEDVVHSKYVYYSTLGAGYDNWKESIFTQATIQNIGADKYAAYYVPVPQIDEQQEIVNYLDKKCAEIDVIITKKRQQLDVLEQYKKSMIYEYVTGKKEVIIND